MSGPSFCAVILAAGEGSRMESAVKKQFMEIGGHPLIYYPLKTFQETDIDKIILVSNMEDIEYCLQIVNHYGFSKVSIVSGGETRAESVFCGLKMVNEDYVLIHDGARAFVSKDVILRCMEGAVKYNACIAAVPSKDTIKLKSFSSAAPETGIDPFIEATPRRDMLYCAQTPQAFKTEVIRNGYRRALFIHQNSLITDDASVLEGGDFKVHMVKGDYLNIKITEPGDLIVAKSILERLQNDSFV